MERDRIVKKEFESLKKKIASFNNLLLMVRKKCQTDDVYLDTSGTGTVPEFISQMTYSCSDSVMKISCHNNNRRHDEWEIVAVEYEDGDFGFEGVYEFEQDLNWMKKCIRKGLKYWMAEDPDKFLDQDDDED